VISHIANILLIISKITFMRNVVNPFCARNLVRFATLVLIFFTFACTSTKKLVYFDNIQDSVIKLQSQPPEAVIQRNDLISIAVNSLNPEATAIFNSPNESTPNANNATANDNTLTVGYLVNPNGDIQFPILGAIHVEGLTKSQLTAMLIKQLTDKKLLVDPIVTIRHLNFRVSVLGEVSTPGVFTIPNEKISILEALGLAGDITIYGKKDNVLIIRQSTNGEKITKRVNLKSAEILSSPYYYLQSNDVVYVEPSTDRVAKERNIMLLPIVLSVTTLLVVIIDRIGR
jgi:polysaccharide export outer membrane protein